MAAPLLSGALLPSAGRHRRRRAGWTSPAVLRTPDRRRAAARKREGLRGDRGPRAGDMNMGDFQAVPLAGLRSAALSLSMSRAARAQFILHSTCRFLCLQNAFDLTPSSAGISTCLPISRCRRLLMPPSRCPLHGQVDAARVAQCLGAGTELGVRRMRPWRC